MNDKKLSKLQKVNLRDFWEHEAREFTPWLAQQDNLDILSEEIGVDINFIQMEASVGKFNVDILAEDSNSSKKIIIENQLEATDHDHLGKIITYASGYNASIIIWIVKSVCEEHQKAIEWLNEHTDEDINFFLIKIELWQIDNSNLAPKFDIVVCPNTWEKTIKQNSSNVAITNTKLQYLEFWTEFRDYVNAIDKTQRLQTPSADNCYYIAIGASELRVILSINSIKHLIKCSFRIKNRENAQGFFHYLEYYKNDIDKHFDISLTWSKGNKDYSQINIFKNVDNVFDLDERAECFSWMYSNIVKFKQIFGKYFAEFKQQQIG